MPPPSQSEGVLPKIPQCTWEYHISSITKKIPTASASGNRLPRTSFPLFVGAAKLPRPDEPRKVVAPESVGADSPPPSPEHVARNSPIIWAAVVLLLCGAALSWWFHVGNNLVTYFLMVVAVIFILLNAFGLRNPPG